ncbi:MAG: DUF4349 domain-containing protein [bacterium]|nr:DUF4349 domain-containing protein [bacterium]
MRKGTKIALWIVGALAGFAIVGFALLWFVGGVMSQYSSDYEDAYAPGGGGLGANYLKESSALSLGFMDMALPAPSGKMMGWLGSAPESSGGGSVAAEVKDRLIIKNGWESVVVDDVPGSVKRLTDFVEQNGGFVVSSNISDFSEAPSAEVVVRVLAEKLDATIAFVKEGSARVVSESVTGEDVTEEFVDQKAHLKNLEAQEARYREILGRANTVEEILQVQQYINNTRDEINRTTARVKYLEESAKYSRLVVNMATDELGLPVVGPGEKWRPGLVAKQAVRALIKTAGFVANMVIRLVILAPIWVPPVAVIWWLVRRRRNRSK